MTSQQRQYCEFWVNANRRVRLSGTANFKKEKIQVNNVYNFNYIEKELEDYQDKDVIKFFKYGWPLNAADTARQQEMPQNQKGAVENQKKLQEYIKAEIEQGTAIGPFRKNPFGPAARISPLNAIPKKDSDDLRIILNLSHPFKKDSVNHSISKEMFCGKPIKLKYPTVEDLVKIVQKKQRKNKVLIYKVDLKKAYKQMFNDPGDIHLLGYRIGNKIYFDVTLSMGSRSAAFCCQSTTNTVTYIMDKNGFEIGNYLDDLGGADEQELAWLAFNKLQEILRNMGLKEAEAKAVQPTAKAAFLGILFDTEKGLLIITPERLNELNKILSEWIQKSEMCLKDLQSLLGKLSFACNTVRAGRIFVSRLINIIKIFPSEGIHKLDEEAKKDISWWSRFMSKFDGVTMMPDSRWAAPNSVISTDACLQGCGAWSRDTCFFRAFPDKLFETYDNIYINELELLAIVASFHLWSRRIQNKNVLFYCDNSTTVDVVNAGKAKNKFAQKCLREICWVTSQVNAMIRVVHQAGVKNRTADLLSRAVIGPSHRTACLQEINSLGLFLMDVTDDIFSFSHDW